MASKARGGGIPWRLIGWAVPLVLLTIPWLGGWPWTLSDFVFAAVMFGIVGGLFELTVRSSGDWAYRGGVAVALLISLMLIWINGAVGIIGNEDNPANLMFFAVILLAIAGAFAARFKAAGMARAMLFAGAAQLAIAVCAALLRLGAADPPGFAQLLVLIVLLSLPWFASALLFRQAGRA